MAARASSNADFDAEALRLFEKLKPSLPQGRAASNSLYAPLSALTGDAATGGVVYVGNRDAASDRDVLRAHNITHVVNCTDSMPFFHEADATVSYLRFDVSAWCLRARNGGRAADVDAFTKPLFSFVRAALARGESVLVHCLAGAHRAGTTGCALLMELDGLDAATAVATAKSRRPIIEPIGMLPELLRRLQDLKASRR